MSASMRHRLNVYLEGGLLIGGKTSDGRRVHTMVDREGRPIIPGSTLKGVIRHAYERLFPDGSSDALFGMPGFEPFATPGEDASLAVTTGRVCKLSIGDARVAIDSASSKMLVDKPQVAIDPDTGRARDHRFFVRRTVAPFAGLCFEATMVLDALDADETRRLDAAIASVFALGAGRSAGLGRVHIERLVGQGVGEQGRALVEVGESLAPGGGEWLLDLVAEEPLNLGTERLLGNYYPSRREIPARTLRGAIVTAALRRRGIRRDLSEAPAFHRLILDPETCLRFGDARPVAQDDRSSRLRLPRPAPRSLRRCKHAAHHAGQSRTLQRPTDTLLESYLRLLAARHGVHAGSVAGCAVCGMPMRRVDRDLDGTVPRRSFRTRVRIDQRTGRAEEGYLFAVELVAPGTRFRARLGALDDDALHLLEDAAAAGLFVGHGRGQGYGRMRIVGLRPAPPPRLLEQRVAAFDTRVERALERLARLKQVPRDALDAPAHHVALTLRSPLVLVPDRGLRLEAAALEMLDLGDGVRIVDSDLTVTQRSGWNALADRPKAVEPALAAGSVLLVGTDRPPESLLERLRAIEARGAGQRREEGYGWVDIGDPAEQTEPTEIAGEQFAEEGTTHA
ncbi:MAG: RAMP superfamily CRISPR-associated protein [Acidobacteriota bacterium]